MADIETPYLRSDQDVLHDFGVELAQGLSRDEASRRKDRYGPNKLREQEPVGLFTIFVRQFKSAVVLLLGVAAVVSFAFGETLEGGAIVAVIVINSLIGFFTELSAVRSMEALYKLGSVSTRVRRDGRVSEIDATDVVPGDIVVLEGGDIVTADMRIVEASRLQADESPLTGESVPVHKQTDVVDEEAPIAERVNMLYKGTSVTRGSGAGVVVATGMNTELGHITKLVTEAEEEETPLEKRLDALGRRLVWVIIVIAAVVAGLGIVRGKEILKMVETGIALAVASIPEGLPIVATIALSRGLLRMARRQALVRQLSSVETLGSASVIFTDKTGTLTENRMTVTRFDFADGAAVRQEDGHWDVDDACEDVFEQALRVAVLCNNASVSREEGKEPKTSGDPLEAALLLAALENGIDPDELRREAPEVYEEPFDSESKKMATFHEVQEAPLYVAVKGAPEATLQACNRIATRGDARPLDDDEREAWLEKNTEIATEGFRMLAIGYKYADSEQEPPYEGITFLALVGLHDPPRKDVRSSIEGCTDAGIRVIMVTGDQAPTARFVANEVGIESNPDAPVVQGHDLHPPDELGPDQEKAMRDANIFARVDPQQKLDLIALHQKTGSIVAMTGDGVNDAPALKKADIGVAMGKRGTQVAREVADVVLKDDAFKTIVYAIQEGRIIFGNIRKFVLYLLSCNIAEILVIFLASLVNAPLPILPLQILFLNLVTDVFPALALGVGEGNPGVMRGPPRPAKEPILTRAMWGSIAIYGIFISGATLAVFFIARGPLNAGLETSVTMAFLTLAATQLMHVFDMRDSDTNVVNNGITRNPWVWGALVLCVGLVLMAVYLPGLSEVLKTTPLTPFQWLLVACGSIVPVIMDGGLRIAINLVRRSKG